MNEFGTTTSGSRGDLATGDQRPPMTWREIEGAPRDGAPVLLWLAKKPDRNWTVRGVCDNHAIGFWGYGRWLSIEVEDCGSMGGEETGWMSDWCSLDLEPTHWMPLPSGPSNDSLGTEQVEPQPTVGVVP